MTTNEDRTLQQNNSMSYLTLSRSFPGSENAQNRDIICPGFFKHELQTRKKMNMIISRCVVFIVILSNFLVFLCLAYVPSLALFCILSSFFFYHVWCSCLRSPTRDTGEGKIEDIFLQDRAKVFHLSPCTFKSVLKPGK